MDKRIITISREFGSSGRTIGKLVADALGIPYYDKELVKQIAAVIGFGEAFIETAGEDAPVKSQLAYAFSMQGILGAMGGLSSDTGQ